MFKTESIVFTELHKTGGTHITAILQELLGGETIGKHNRLTKNEDHLFKLASVRNPWDWYASLWAYGCLGKGSVFQNTTKKQGFKYYYDQLPKEMGKNRLKPNELALQLLNDIKKDYSQWKNLYANSDDADLFRQWIKRLLDPNHKYDIGEGFGFSPISAKHGLMTYRFIKLLSHHQTDIYAKDFLKAYRTVEQLWDQTKNIDYIVRNENLEADLATALKMSGYSDMENYQKLLQEKFQTRTNSSKRKSAEYYYDEETIELVKDKERLIINLFDYTPPSTNSK